eukprot:1155141-Pelagomonas_calceolata.AAC.4
MTQAAGRCCDGCRQGEEVTEEVMQDVEMTEAEMAAEAAKAGPGSSKSSGAGPSSSKAAGGSQQMLRGLSLKSTFVQRRMFRRHQCFMRISSAKFRKQHHCIEASVEPELLHKSAWSAAAAYPA